MKILLTGEPNSGKTTILKGVISGIQRKQGFVTEQILKDGQRVGFELVSAGGKRALLASVDSESNVRVSKYGVEIDIPTVKPGELVYVDEVGQMELQSEKFKKLVKSYMRLPNHLIGTISAMYEDELTKAIVQRQDVMILTVQANSREAVRDILAAFVDNLHYIFLLDENMKSKVTAMACGYASSKNYLQLKKLYRNAVRYVVEGRITSVESGHYIVQGDHEAHHVCIDSDNYSCDCKLFKGEGGYAGQQGECSHIQSVKLLVT